MIVYQFEEMTRIEIYADTLSFESKRAYCEDPHPL